MVDVIIEWDLLFVMDIWGVMIFIFDFGVICYWVNIEEWLIFDKKKFLYWVFEKGIYLEQFDLLFYIDVSIKVDMVYYYDCDWFWKFIGNVDIKSLKGDYVIIELLYWNEVIKKVYIDKFVWMEKLDQIMIGYGFELDDQFMKLVVYNIFGIVYIDEDVEKVKIDFVN